MARTTVATAPARAGDTAAAGTPVITGTSAQTLDDATATASGAVGSGSVDGTAAVTLADATGSASGSPIASGTAAVTLEAAAGAAAGWAGSVDGTADVTLADATGAAEGIAFADDRTPGGTAAWLPAPPRTPLPEETPREFRLVAVGTVGITAANRLEFVVGRGHAITATGQLPRLAGVASVRAASPVGDEQRRTRRMKALALL